VVRILTYEICSCCSTQFNGEFERLISALHCVAGN
jgi:hypothetical protein